MAQLGDARDEKPCNVAMKNVLTFDAVADAATGMALLIVPSLVGRLLFGEGTHSASPRGTLFA